MIQLIYTSTAARHLTDEDLLAIVAKARERNQKEFITGMLLYRDRCFLQLLEGEESAVTACYARIARDQRHRSLLQITTVPIQSREFPDWTMGFHDLGALSDEQNARLEPYLDQSFDSAAFAKNPTFAQKLIREFKNTRFWRGASG